MSTPTPVMTGTAASIMSVRLGDLELVMVSPTGAAS